MTHVKILGCAWSPRHGNTEILIKEALEAAKSLQGVETVFWSVSGKKMEHCTACYGCVNSPVKEPCPGPKDAFNEAFNLVAEADGIVFGSPTWTGNISSYLKAFIDRGTLCDNHHGLIWRNKVVGGITVAYDRNGGQEATIASIFKFAMMNDMVFVSQGAEHSHAGQPSMGGYSGAMAHQGWPNPIPSNTAEGRKAVLQDKMGLQAARNVGFRVAEVAKVVKEGLLTVPKKELHWPPGEKIAGIFP